MNCVGCIVCRIYLFFILFYHHGTKLFLLRFLYTKVAFSSNLTCMPLLYSSPDPKDQFVSEPGSVSKGIRTRLRRKRIISYQMAIYPVELICVMAGFSTPL
jgi:hypothetical protein